MQSQYLTDPTDPRTWLARARQGYQGPKPPTVPSPRLPEGIAAQAVGSRAQYRKGLGDTLESALPRYFGSLQGTQRELVKSYLYASQVDRKTGKARRPDDPGDGEWQVPTEAIAEALTALKRGESERLARKVEEFRSQRSEASRYKGESERLGARGYSPEPSVPSDPMRDRMLLAGEEIGTPESIGGVPGSKGFGPVKQAGPEEPSVFRQGAEAVQGFYRAAGEAAGGPFKPASEVAGAIVSFPLDIAENLRLANTTDDPRRAFGHLGMVAVDMGIVDAAAFSVPNKVRTAFLRNSQRLGPAAEKAARLSDAEIVDLGRGVQEEIVTLQQVKSKARAEAGPEPAGQNVNLVQMAEARTKRTAPYTEAEWRDVTASAEQELRKVGKMARANQLKKSLASGVPDPEVDQFLREEMAQRVTPASSGAPTADARTPVQPGTPNPVGPVRLETPPTPQSATAQPAGVVDEAASTGPQAPRTEAPLPPRTATGQAAAQASPEPVSPPVGGTATEPPTVPLTEGTPKQRVSEILGEKSDALSARAEQIKARRAARLEQGLGGRAGAGLGAFDPKQLQDFADAIELGAVKLAQFGTDRVKWAASMVEYFGDTIKPHLDAIYARIASGTDDVEQTAREAMAEAASGPSVTGAVPDERLRLQDLEKIAQEAGISLDGLRVRKTMQGMAEETAESFDAYAESVRTLAKSDLAPNQSITANQRLAGHVVAKQTAQEAKTLEASLKAAQEAGDAEGAMRLSSQLADKEEELAKVVRLLYKTGSADGFNLAMHRYRLSDYDSAADLVRLERLSRGTATPEVRSQLVALTDRAKLLRDKIAELKRAAKAEPDAAIKKLEKDVADLDAKRARLMADAQKPTFLDELTMFRQAGLLSNPRTIIRNFIGNAVNALRDEGLRSADWLADQAVRIVAPRATQGRQAVKAFVPGGTKKWGRTFEKSVEDMKSVLRTGITPEEAARLDIRQEARFAPTKYALRFQGIQDKPWYVRAYTQSLWEQASLIKKSNKADDLLELVNDPTEAMQVQAMQDAAISTFSEPNVLADAIAGIGRDRPLARFLVRLLVPFVKVPTNIGKRLLKANVLGTAYDVGESALKVRARGKALGGQGVLTPFEQKTLAKSITDGTLGTALLWYGYELASQGKATGKSPGSAKERETMYMTGRQPSDVQVGGTSLRTSGTSPWFSLVTLGAAMHDYHAEEQERYERESERFDKLREKGTPESELERPLKPKKVGPTEVGKAVKDVLLEFPFFKGVKDVVSETSDAEGFLANLAASFVPGLPGDIRQTVNFDPEMRDPRARRSALQQTRDQIFMKLGMRESVLPRVDPLGRSAKQSRPWDVFGSRGLEDDPVVKAIADTGLQLSVESMTERAKGLSPDDLLKRQTETGQKVYDTIAKDPDAYRDYSERYGRDSLQKIVDAQVRDIRDGKEPRPLLPPDPRTGGVQSVRRKSFSGLSGLPR